MSEPALKFVPPLDSKAPQTASSNFNKKWLIITSCLFVTAVVCKLSYNWFVYSKSHIETNNAYIDGDIFHVQSRMMGFIKTMSVEEDQEVKEGQVLMLLDETDINVEKSFKEAKYKKAQADFDRAQALVKSKLISVSDFEVAQASLVAATADYKGSELKLLYTEITAPADGVIARSYVKSGQFIQPGQNLLTLVSQKKIWIKANYKETQIEKIKAGQITEIQVDAYPGVMFYGKVDGIYPSSGSVLSLIPPENATGNFTKVVQRVPVKITVENKPGYELRPGMSVLTSIKVEQK